jgi:hypothetical protein
MHNQPITEQLAILLADVDERRARQRAAESHADTLERLKFLHDLLATFQAMLKELHTFSSTNPDLYKQTCLELRATMPAGFASPAHALISGNLDLLRLVEYTSGSIMLLKERLAVFKQASGKGN